MKQIKTPYQIKETLGARVRFSFYHDKCVYTRSMYVSIDDAEIDAMTGHQLYTRLEAKVKEFLTLLETATKSTACHLLMCAERTPWECVNCTNCKNCVNCVNCVNCENLHSCEYCKNCIKCVNCYNCTDCKNCASCANCVNCKDCSSCNVCSACGKCKECSYCHLCDNVSHSSHCENAQHSYHLKSCKNCIQCKNLIHRQNLTFESGDERMIHFSDDNSLPF